MRMTILGQLKLVNHVPRLALNLIQLRCSQIILQSVFNSLRSIQSYRTDLIYFNKLNQSSLLTYILSKNKSIFYSLYLMDSYPASYLRNINNNDYHITQVDQNLNFLASYSKRLALDTLIYQEKVNTEKLKKSQYLSQLMPSKYEIYLSIIKSNDNNLFQKVSLSEFLNRQLFYQKFYEMNLVRAKLRNQINQFYSSMSQNYVLNSRYQLLKNRYLDQNVNNYLQNVVTSTADNILTSRHQILKNYHLQQNVSNYLQNIVTSAADNALASRHQILKNYHLQQNVSNYLQSAVTASVTDHRQPMWLTPRSSDFLSAPAAKADLSFSVNPLIYKKAVPNLVEENKLKSTKSAMTKTNVKKSAVAKADLRAKKSVIERITPTDLGNLAVLVQNLIERKLRITAEQRGLR